MSVIARRSHLATPRYGASVSQQDDALAQRSQTEREGLVREELKDFDELWEQLFVPEQRKLLAELLEQVIVAEDGVKLHLKRNNLTTWVEGAQHANKPRAKQRHNSHSSAA